MNSKLGDFQVIGKFLLNQIGYVRKSDEDGHAN